MSTYLRWLSGSDPVTRHPIILKMIIDMTRSMGLSMGVEKSVYFIEQNLFSNQSTISDHVRRGNDGAWLGKLLNTRLMYLGTSINNHTNSSGSLGWGKRGWVFDLTAGYLSFFLRTTAVSTLPSSRSLSMSSADI
jgi:hypothetical protein